MFVMAPLVPVMSSLIRAPPPPSSIIVNSNTKPPPSFPCCSIPTRASTLSLPTPSVSISNCSSSSSSSSSRFKIAIRWQTGRRRRGLSTSAVFASNSSSPSGSSRDSTNDKSDEKTISTSDAAPRGPPFLTILAGFLVFSLFVWIFGSIITWLFSFTVKVPPPK